MFLLFLLSEHYAKSWGCGNKQDNLSLCSQEVDISGQGLSWWHLWSTQGSKGSQWYPLPYCLRIWKLPFPLCSWSVSEVLVENILFFISFKRGLENTCMCLESVTTFASDKMNGDRTKPSITKWKLYQDQRIFIF